MRKAGIVLGLLLVSLLATLDALGASGWTHTSHGVTCASWAKARGIICGPKGATRSFGTTISRTLVTVFSLPSGRAVFVRSQPAAGSTALTPGGHAYGVTCKASSSGVVACFR